MIQQSHLSFLGKNDKNSTPSYTFPQALGGGEVEFVEIYNRCSTAMNNSIFWNQSVLWLAAERKRDQNTLWTSFVHSPNPAIWSAQTTLDFSGTPHTSKVCPINPPASLGPKSNTEQFRGKYIDLQGHKWKFDIVMGLWRMLHFNTETCLVVKARKFGILEMSSTTHENKCRMWCFLSLLIYFCRNLQLSEYALSGDTTHA